MRMQPLGARSALSPWFCPVISRIKWKNVYDFTAVGMFVNVIIFKNMGDSAGPSKGSVS